MSLKLIKYRCPICDGESVFFRNVRGNIRFPSDKDIYIFYRCIECDHVFRTNLLEKTIYTDDYYSYSASENSLFSFIKFLFIHQRRPWVSFFWKIVENTTRYQNCPLVDNGNVLDIGGGDGFALNLYKLTNNKTYNIEISEKAINRSKKNGHRTYRIISKIRNVKFNLIRMNHVLEHVRDPQSIVDNCIQRLMRGGEIIICIPNINSLSFALFGDKFDELSCPDHIHFFSEKSLRIMLKKIKTIQISYPLHKSGVVTNLNLILGTRYKLFNSWFFVFFSMLLCIPFNLISAYSKRTHLITIRCFS